MTRLLMLCALIAFTGPSRAQSHWLQLGANDRADIYIDAVYTVQSPTYIKAWTLLSFNEATDDGWRSEKRLFLYSCKEKSLEWQQSIFYSEPMGEGEFVNVRSLSKQDDAPLATPELDPATKDERFYRDAVPESAFINTFSSFC